MASSDQYRAIPVGDHTGHLHSSPSTGNKSLFYVIGAVLLVAATAFVTAHVTTDRYEFGASRFSKMAPVGSSFRSMPSYGNTRATGPGMYGNNRMEVVRAMVDDICSSITYTACRYIAAADTDWCKICKAYM